MNKRNERGVNFFLDLLILRERHRLGTRRLVIRLHIPKVATPTAVPILFRHPSQPSRRFLGENFSRRN